MRPATEDDVEIASRIPVTSNLWVRIWKEVPPRNGYYIPSTIYIQISKGDECFGNKLEISKGANNSQYLNVRQFLTYM
jgi:hypothetical protein